MNNLKLVLSAKTKLIKTEVLVLPIFETQKLKTILSDYLPEASPEFLENEFKRKPSNSLLLYPKHGETKRILLFALEKQAEFNLSSWRAAVLQIMHLLRSLPAENAAMLMPKVGARTLSDYVQMFSFAAVFANYNFEEYKKTTKDDPIKLSSISLVVPRPNQQVKNAFLQGQIIGRATNTARNLSNHPGNIATPTHLAKHAQALGKKHKFKVAILDRPQIKKEGLSLLLGVSKGSEEPPKFLVLDYGPKNKQPVILIGKGLTFDSGGVSIKPAEKMEEMKYDMAGAATVLGVFEAAAELKLPIRLVGLVPSSENLLSGKAVKPGDILTSHAGSTVEIINTDAEGRLVLADAISYAKKHYDPRVLLDFATLTGAVVVALGDRYAGILSNTDKFSHSLKTAAARSAEKFWNLPLVKEYEKQLKSSIADIKNVGERGSAGVITAALFLKHFAGQTPWIHFDIAGTAWTTKPNPGQPAGATGWGVFLTSLFLQNLKNK